MSLDQGLCEPNLAPMMIEPLSALDGQDYQGIEFLGPARTGKTMALILGGITYVIACSPGDMLVPYMSQDNARPFL